MSAGTISALASLLTAAAVFLTAWRTGRQVKTAADSLAVKTEEQSGALIGKANMVEERVAEVHEIVNSQKTELLREIELLKARLGMPADINPREPELTPPNKPKGAP